MYISAYIVCTYTFGHVMAYKLCMKEQNNFKFADEIEYGLFISPVNFSFCAFPKNH